jgi:hypothetical protein
MFRNLFRPLALCSLAPDSGGGSGSGEGGQEATPTDANPGGKSDGDGGATSGQEPYAIFPDAATFAARMDREATARLSRQAKEAGYESVEDLLADAKAKQEADKAAQSETERLTQERDQAVQTRDEALAGANQRLVQAEARALAAEKGVKTERVPYLLRLADLSGVKVNDEGDVDTAALTAAVVKVLEDMPELVETETARKRSGLDLNGQQGASQPQPEGLAGAIAGHYKKD